MSIITLTKEYVAEIDAYVPRVNVGGRVAYMMRFFRSLFPEALNEKCQQMAEKRFLDLHPDDVIDVRASECSNYGRYIFADAVDRYVSFANNSNEMALITKSSSFFAGRNVGRRDALAERQLALRLDAPSNVVKLRANESKPRLSARALTLLDKPIPLSRRGKIDTTSSVEYERIAFQMARDRLAFFYRIDLDQQLVNEVTFGGGTLAPILKTTVVNHLEHRLQRMFNGATASVHESNGRFVLCGLIFVGPIVEVNASEKLPALIGSDRIDKTRKLIGSIFAHRTHIIGHGKISVHCVTDPRFYYGMMADNSELLFEGIAPLTRSSRKKRTLPQPYVSASLRREIHEWNRKRQISVSDRMTAALKAVVERKAQFNSHTQAA